MATFVSIMEAATHYSVAVTKAGVVSSRKYRQIWKLYKTRNSTMGCDAITVKVQAVIIALR